MAENEEIKNQDSVNNNPAETEILQAQETSDADGRELDTSGGDAKEQETAAGEGTVQDQVTADNKNDTQDQAAEAHKDKKKKKHKGLKIALIAVFAILVILGGLFAYAYATQTEYVKNTWAMFTKNDTEYFHWVMDRNIAKIEENFKEHTEKTKDIKPPEDWSAKGRLAVSLTPELGQKFLGNNFAGIKDAGLKYEVSAGKDKNLGALITPFYKNIDLLDIGGLIEPDDKKIYLAIPSYRSEAVELSSWLQKLQEEKGIDLDLGKIIDTEDFKKKLESFKGSMNAEKLDQLIHIIYDEVDTAELQKKQTVTVNGLEAEVNILSGKLEKDKCDKIIDEYLDELFNAVPALIPDINISGLMSSGLLNGALNNGTGNVDGSVAGLLEGLNGGSLGNLDVGSLSGLLGGSLGGLGDGLLNDIGKTAIEKLITNAKDSLKKKIDEYAISIEFSIYVDAKGDILGGMVKIAANETKVKLDALKLYDKDNPDKSKCGIDVSLNGIKLASALCETEKKDGKKFFDVKVKPGAVVEMVLKGASTYELAIKGSISDPDPNRNELDFDARLTSPGGEIASIVLKNSFAGGSSKMPIDTSESNVIDIMEFPDSDYIDLEKLLKPILGKLDEINDEGLNNFISNFMQEQLGLGSIDISGLKTMVDNGLVNAGNSIVRDRLKKMLGIEPPYDYSSVSEKPKESEDGNNYVYSWDIFQDAPASTVYDGLAVKVYDHYQRLDEYKPDLEKEKNKFLSAYLGQGFEREAADDEGIEMGDVVTFDVVPVIGSMAIESYAYPGEKTTIGSYDYGEGIDDQLLGVKKGETRDLTLTLDDRYGAFAGYTGVFRITIKAITKVTKPEWSEEFIVGQLGYSSVDALEAELMEKAEQNYEDLEAQYGPSGEGLMAILIDQVVSKIDISSCGDEAAESARKYQDSLAAIAGTELSQILKAAGYSEEEILKLVGVDKSIPDYAVRRRIMDEVVAKAENISIPKANYENRMNELAEALGYSNGNAFMEAVGNKYGQRFFVDMFIDREAAAVLFGKTDFDWN